MSPSKGGYSPRKKRMALIITFDRLDAENGIVELRLTDTGLKISAGGVLTNATASASERRHKTVPTTLTQNQKNALRALVEQVFTDLAKQELNATSVTRDGFVFVED